MLRPFPTAAGLLLLGLMISSSALTEPAPDRLIVRFFPGMVRPPAGTTEAPTQEFSFSSPGLRDALLFEGVERLARLFPEFRLNAGSTRNLIGEPIVLDDLSEFYLASIRIGAREGANVRIRAIHGVTYADWPKPRSASSTYPGDFYFSKQWGLHNTGQSFCAPNYAPPADSDADINAPEAWDIEQGLNADVRVGVIDSGIRASHDDFEGRVVLSDGVSFVPVEPPWAPSCTPQTSVGTPTCEFDDPDVEPDDDLLHGTAVAGIIAATGDNTVGVAGVAWGVTPIAIKVITSANTSLSCLSARALDWARADSIPILNMSYQGGSPDAAELAAARNAFYSGMLLVAAAGNDDAQGLVYPAQYRNTTCAVGAYFANGRRWKDSLINPLSTAGSNYGLAMDLAAPGGRMIATTNWGNRCVNDAYYALTTCANDYGFGGTSAATPIVSGVAALLKCKYSSLLGEDLYQGMIRTARHSDPATADTVVFDDGTVRCFDDSAGFGHVRADDALNFFAAPKEILHRRMTGLSVVDTFSSQRTLQNVPGVTNGTYTVKTYVLRKALTFDPAFASKPSAWVRASGTQGVKDVDPYDYDDQVNWGRIVALSDTGCTLETHVFEIQGVSSLYKWLPIVPTKAAVALTVVGEPVGGGQASAGRPGSTSPDQDHWTGRACPGFCVSA